MLKVLLHECLPLLLVDSSFNFALIEGELWPIERSLQQSSLLLGTSNNKGYARQPLLELEPTQCPPDHLHMRKGIIGKLFSQVSVNVIATHLALYAL